MFKHFVAILLITVLTASSFQRYFIYAGFELNQAYIAKNLCMNRSRPWMHCNGRCYLMRKLKIAEENERKQSEKNTLSRYEVSFFQEPSSINLYVPAVAELLTTALPVFKSLYRYSFTASLLQPPKIKA